MNTEVLEDEAKNARFDPRHLWPQAESKVLLDLTGTLNANQT
jgi:hypothetical protein